MGQTKGRAAGWSSANLHRGQGQPHCVGELPRNSFLGSSVVRRSSKAFRLGQDFIPPAVHQATPSHLDFVQPHSEWIASVYHLMVALQFECIC